MRAVSIEWVDSRWWGEGWAAKEEIVKMRPALCKTLGFIIYEDGECIVLLQTESGEGALNAVTIPRGCIKKINELA